MYLPAATALRRKIALPLFFIADIPQPRQPAGVNQVITVAQRTTPDFLHGVLLKEEVAPVNMFYIQPATGDGEVNVRVLVKLASVGMEGAEDTDFHGLVSGPPEYGVGGGAEQSVEQEPVVVEKWPQQR